MDAILGVASMPIPITPEDARFLRVIKAVAAGDIKIRFRSPILHRLAAKVNLKGKRKKYMPTDCWLWTGDCTRHKRIPRGRIYAAPKVRQVHRVAYALFIGDIPEGLCVMHRCDVGTCLRPSHLRAGTYRDNIVDMVHKE